MGFPTYSKSKYISIRPAIIEVVNDVDEPMFDPILGVETLANIGVVLYFSQKRIILDHVSNPMK